ncbi:hypothetical protein Pelo_4637 [Pelomyxa schiedti]|nr:hypothetical protein Pelo_4637 [Pelomyxa schiedti]
MDLSKSSARLSVKLSEWSAARKKERLLAAQEVSPSPVLPLRRSPTNIINRDTLAPFASKKPRYDAVHRAQPTATSKPKAASPGADAVEDICRLCFANKGNCVIVPCGHLGLCFDCGTLLKNKSSSAESPALCPFCRNPITQLIQTFRV